jgi:hypothetical protein
LRETRVLPLKHIQQHKGTSKKLADKASPQVERRSSLRRMSIFDQGAGAVIRGFSQVPIS